MGLAALALEGNPVFPTYPNRMPQADVSAGLVLPNAAVAMLGKGGAGATLLLIFMAVTSATSAELIAVSSIWTYDIYQHYINPQVRMKSATPSPPAFRCLTKFFSGFRKTSHQNVACLLRWIFNFHGRLFRRFVLCWHQHGLALPLHGRHHLLGCAPCVSDPPLERPKLDRSRLFARARIGCLHHRLAGDSQK
jgi:hypothetical protein